MKHLLIFLGLMLFFQGCSWIKDRAELGKDCAVTAAKEAEVMPHVRRILKEPSWTTVFAELTSLGVDFGRDVVDCLVARFLDDDGTLSAGPDQGLMKSNAATWLERGQ